MKLDDIPQVRVDRLVCDLHTFLASNRLPQIRACGTRERRKLDKFFQQALENRAADKQQTKYEIRLSWDLYDPAEGFCTNHVQWCFLDELAQLKIKRRDLRFAASGNLLNAIIIDGCGLVMNARFTIKHPSKLTTTPSAPGRLPRPAFAARPDLLQQPEAT